MDTVPFHLILFALDITIWGGLYLWLRFRRNHKSVIAARDFERSLYALAIVRQPSRTWDILGVLLFGGFGFVCFAVFSRLIFTDYVQEHIYHFNAGQCIVEGIAIHGTLFLLVAALLLCRNRRYISALLLISGSLVLAAGSFNVLYWEPYHLKVEHYEIKTDKLKKPLRIVFVADIQTDRIGFHEINTLKTIQQQKADLIILGGDYLQTFVGVRDRNLPDNFRQLLLDHPLKAPLGVYAIEGNVRLSDGAGDARLFRATGIEFLSYSTVIDNLGIDKDLGPIDLFLLGLADSRGGLGKNGLTESGNFIVMAGHYPNYAADGYTNTEEGKFSGYRQAERAPDLMLAGHTHGGQIVLPSFGPLFRAGDAHVRQLPEDMWSGFFTYSNGGHLLITRGSGMERGWAPRIRLFCPPEISVIDIVPSNLNNP